MQIIGRGEDALGKFTIAMPGFCNICAEEKSRLQSRNPRVDAVAQYDRKPKVYKQIRPEATILNLGTLEKPRLTRQIGITCGCYGKLHRQYAHMEDSMQTNRQRNAEQEQRKNRKQTKRGN